MIKSQTIFFFFLFFHGQSSLTGQPGSIILYLHFSSLLLRFANMRIWHTERYWWDQFELAIWSTTRTNGNNTTPIKSTAVRMEIVEFFCCFVLHSCLTPDILYWINSILLFIWLDYSMIFCLNLRVISEPQPCSRANYFTNKPRKFMGFSFRCCCYCYCCKIRFTCCFFFIACVGYTFIDSFAIHYYYYILSSPNNSNKNFSVLFFNLTVSAINTAHHDAQCSVSFAFVFPLSFLRLPSILPLFGILCLYIHFVLFHIYSIDMYIQSGISKTQRIQTIFLFCSLLFSPNGVPCSMFSYFHVLLFKLDLSSIYMIWPWSSL